MLLDKNIPFQYVFHKIKYDLIRVLIISASFHIAKIFFNDELPLIPIALPAVLGTSISLLLAFKINQSYERWWEARKVWGAIVNDSRTLVMQLKGFIQDQGLKDGKTYVILKRIAYRQMGWCYCLGRSLRGQNAAQNLHEFVSENELQELYRHNNKPLFLLMQHINDIKKLHTNKHINDYQQVQLDSTVARLTDSMGKSERINNTVFPATYRKFIHFFIYLFLIVLSLALVETIGFYEIPLLTLIASTFFLIEKTATHMQDPFRNRPTDTAVTSIARTIEINIRQLLQEEKAPEPLKADDFYIM